jgi:dinuclear metal center YbgI/SA1388 family protein
MQLSELATALDDLLSTADFPGDRALNGLQVGGDWEVAKVAFALDARLPVVRRAIRGGANLLVVHHGLFWGRPFPLTGSIYDLVSEASGHELGIYACHLPLDAHPEFGVNATWADILGLTGTAPFAQVWGAPLGQCGNLDQTIPLENLVHRIAQETGEEVTVRAYGPTNVTRVAVLAGSVGPGELEAAVAARADVLITGEPSLPTDIAAEFAGINLLFAGHTATEIVGIQALRQEVERRFQLETFLIHEKTGV